MLACITSGRDGLESELLMFDHSLHGVSCYMKFKCAKLGLHQQGAPSSSNETAVIFYIVAVGSVHCKCTGCQNLVKLP